MLMREAYLHDYNIASKEDTSPLKLHTLYPKEDYIEGGLRRRYIRNFANYDIGNLFNISLLDFFELPYPDAVYICEMSKQISETKASQLGNLESSLKG